MFAMNIKKAVTGDLPKLVNFDQLAKNGHSRVDEIKTAIVQGRCWVYTDGGAPQGYAILQTDFFGKPFIYLLYVAPEHRRKGIASRLIRHLETVCGSPKIFTSTNQSNADMFTLLQKLDYQQCGEIHGLDEGDPEIVFMKRVA